MSETSSEGGGVSTPRVARLFFLGDPRYDRRVKSFARFFQRQGYKIELVCGFRRSIGASPPSASDLPSGSTLHLIKLAAKGGALMFTAYNSALRALQPKLDAADVVVACDLYSLGGARRAKQLGKCRRVFYDAREVYTELPSTTHRPFVQWAWSWFERRGMSIADLILVTGRHDLEAIFLRHGFVPRSALVRNLPDRVATLEPLDLRARYAIPRDARVFVYLGGLQQGRGLEVFLRALPKVDETSYLVLIGDGPLRAALERLAEDLGLAARVVFAGVTASDEALRMVGSADVGLSLIEPISLSYEYALPSKLFEYMASGVVALSSKLIHVEELFGATTDIDGSWLTSVDVGSIDSVVDGARFALGLANSESVKARARSLHLSVFNAESELEPLSEILSEMLTGTG